MVVLIPLCLVLAGVFLWREFRKSYIQAVVLKGLASVCFVIFGALCSPGTHTANLIVTGLILGCIADVLLNLRMVFKEQGQKIFLFGILVFLSGHILCLAAVFPLAKHPVLCVVIGILLTALLMIWIFQRITAKKAFKIFGVIYIGAIVLLNCVAVSNLITSPSVFTAVFAAGSLLFLISDIVLILNTFGPESRFRLRITNISLYYLGQILIALSLLFHGAV